MIQFILILLGITFPNNNTSTTIANPMQITMQDNLSPGDGMDTGGETTQTPPKK